MKLVTQGQLVRLTATFRTLAGALVDPDTVSVEISREADGVSTIDIYNHLGSDLFRTSLGIYYIDVDTSPTGGIWHWRFEATGTGQNAQQGTFYATPASVDASDSSDDESPAEITSLRADLAASDGSTLVGFIQEGTGATVRNAQSKMREQFSIKDFGATGDGVTDDTAAIQAAIDALPNGGTLLLPRGVYKITSSLNVSHRSSLQISGQGSAGGDDATAGITTIKWSGANSGNPFFIDCTRDSIFENFAILPGTGTIGIGILIDQVAPSGNQLSDNNKFSRILIGASTTGVQVGKDQADGNNAEHTFEDVWITGAGTYGFYIKFSQSRNISFVRGSISTRQYGIYHLHGSSRIYGVNFSYITGVDIYVTQSNDTIFIEGCHDENSAAFLGTGGYSGVNFACYLLGNSFIGTANAVNPMIEYKFAGPFVMIGNDWAGGSYFAAPKFNISGFSPISVVSIGNVFPNNLVFTGAVGSYTLNSTGDKYVDSGGDAQAMPNVAEFTTVAVTGTIDIGAITADSIAVNGDAAQNRLLSGTYVPTLTNVANVAASTAHDCSYLQVGKTVTVSGYVSVTPTASGNVNTEIDLTVPVLNSLDIDAMGGLAMNGAGGLQGVLVFQIVFGNGNKARFFGTNVNTTAAADYYFTFTYHLAA